MSGTLTDMLGMGSNGTGLTGMGGTLSPQLMRLLAMRQALAQVPQQGNMAPQLAAGRGAPTMPNQAPMMQPQTPQQMPGQMSQAMGGNLPQLLAALKGGQTGVTPQQGPGGGQALPVGANMPSWLAKMLPPQLLAQLGYGAYGAAGTGANNVGQFVGPGGLLGGGT